MNKMLGLMLALEVLCFCRMAAIAQTAEHDSTDRPIAIHPDNPRYFIWKGEPTVLVASGEHFGSVINPDFDYKRYLETVRAVGLNHTRLFLGDYVEGAGAFGIVDNTLAPAPGRFLAPWARSEAPGFALGGNKFDLDRWDPAYFKRLHGFMREAFAREIVVEAVLFFVGPGWNNAPLNSRNNVNNTTRIDARKYLSLDNGNVLARQESYCRKLVRELNGYDNLFFNLCNEPWFDNQERPGFVSQPPVEVKAWLRRVAEWVVDEEAKLPKKHFLSVDISNQGTVISPPDLESYFPHLSLFCVHYDANAESLFLNRTLGKAFGFNETGFNGTADDLYRVQGWNYLLSGGALYGHLDFSFTVGHEDGTATPKFLYASYSGGGSAPLRRQLRILLDFMNSIPFVEMQLDNSVVVGGAESWSALGWPAHAHAIWFPGEGPVEPLLNLTPGNWTAEWVDILTGTVTKQEFAHKGWAMKLRGERRGGGVALRLFRRDASTG
jgi:hypothetical protein